MSFDTKKSQNKHNLMKSNFYK